MSMDNRSKNRGNFNRGPEREGSSRDHSQGSRGDRDSGQRGRFGQDSSGERRPKRGFNSGPRAEGSQRSSGGFGRFRDRNDRGEGRSGGFRPNNQFAGPKRDQERGFRPTGTGLRGENVGSDSAKRAMFLRRSRETVMEALRSRDMVLAGVTKSIEDINESMNLLTERLEAWYGVYFPELRFDEQLKYCNAIIAIDREHLDLNELSAVFGQSKAQEIISCAAKTLGAKLSPEDLRQCRALASTIVSMGKLREEYEKYQATVADELCPNLSVVGGPEIAAKLVSHVGSLKKLALLPSSTIQVLGAEKSLFKHLRNRRVPPPKHGIIFQHPRISSAPKSVRGKIARTLANKLAIAAKADSFTKNSIGVMLKTQFEERCTKIMGEYEREKQKNPARRSEH